MRSVWWPRLIGALVIGYHCFTREFAYIGIPPARMFIGEITLGAIVIFRPHIMSRWLLGSLARPTSLSMIAYLSVCFTGYGLWEICRGLLMGYELKTALENAVFTIYPVYFFVGVWAGLERPGLFLTILRLLGWVSGIYGVLWVLVIAPPPNIYDDTGAGLLGFTQPSASAVSMLALICISHRFSRDLPLIGLNAFCVLALQMRAEWLAVMSGLGVWVLFTRRVGGALGALAGCALLLCTLQVLNIEIPGRTGSVSMTETTARLVAPFSPELAEQLSPNNAVGAIGSAAFRSEWWGKIWQAANADTERFLVGWGFGFPLRSLVFDADLREGVRSPHGVFFYALGYMGWVGVILFFALQAAIGWQCWGASRRSGNPAAIVYWVASMTIGLMSNTFETPFGAIPFYLVCGLAMEPVVARFRQAAGQPRPAVPLTIPG